MSINIWITLSCPFVPSGDSEVCPKMTELQLCFYHPQASHHGRSALQCHIPMVVESLLGLEEHLTEDPLN